ncbi:MAG: FRG domain-containing protein, partial [Fibrella sp.]|nr:FRG domain-containing protein [Armatimonadota bacterium]
WSYSPYVALHFTTCETALWDRDGAVWCVDFAHFNRRLPQIMQEVLKIEGATVFTAEMIAECADSVSALDGLAPDPFLLFFEPPSFDDRIVNQFALFALLSGADTVMGQWLRAQEGEALRRIVIPAGLKREVRDRLDQIGVTERVLLPGLDGLSAWLSRYYGYRIGG